MYPSFWAQFHDFFETALYWFASTFNLTAEFAKIRGALEEFFWAMESIFEGFSFASLRRIFWLLKNKSTFFGCFCF